VVTEVGAEVRDFEAGDRVVAMIPWVRIGGRTGAYAQAAALDPEWLAPLPGGVDEVTAATVPLNALTASQALDLIAGPPGSTILITGASGAVGGYAVQLAARRGLQVVAVASHGDEKWVAGLGAHRVLPRCTDLSQIDGVDALLDAVPIGAAAAHTVRAGGVAVFTRRVGDVADGRDLRVETPLVRIDPVALAELTRQVAAGELRTRVAMTLDLEDAAEAHRLAERGGLRGKVVLTTR
jgi:NADPH:quinone reductase-like Zn-dependent oxidoreductase